MIARIKNSRPLRFCTSFLSLPRARNDYATHVPILIGLAKIRRIRTVLEFGCGYYSTLTFLNRSAFPYLERLQSIENDASWAESIKEAANNDDRWNLSLVDGDIADCLQVNSDNHVNPVKLPFRAKSLEAYDLILIDDSKSSAQRAATIHAVAACQPERPWIVIHDYEVEEYRNAARGFEQRYAFKTFTPQTGLVCNKPAHEVKSLGRLLTEHSKHLQPDDVEGWTSAFCRS
jgi:Predicted O-methyltransferase